MTTLLPPEILGQPALYEWHAGWAFSNVKVSNNVYVMDKDCVKNYHIEK